jgi:hypothetical protein
MRPSSAGRAPASRTAQPATRGSTGGRPTSRRSAGGTGALRHARHVHHARDRGWGRPGAPREPRHARSPVTERVRRRTRTRVRRRGGSLAAPLPSARPVAGVRDRRHRGLVSPGGTLLVVAYEPGAQLGTTPVTADDPACSSLRSSSCAPRQPRWRVRLRSCSSSCTAPARPCLRELVNATRSDAGWGPAEINCTAGWIERRWVVEMAPPIITIRWCTDEDRAPDPRCQRACARSLRRPRGAQARRREQRW